MGDKPATKSEKEQIYKEFIAMNPPKVRFIQEIRDALGIDQEGHLDHLEFMMSCLELHPFVPFDFCSYGSDLLDVRRALAFHIILRYLGHLRSFIANVNIRNRVGMGSSLRCMLEIQAFAEFFSDPQRLGDFQLLELFVIGQAFLDGYWSAGSWYELERIWMKEFNQPLPNHIKDILKTLSGLPRAGFLKSSATQDQGFAYVYSRYSEFVHPAFARPRSDFEGALEVKDPHPWGSKEYFTAEARTGAPIELIRRDVEAACLCMQFFWVKALHIDPHFDEALRPQIVSLIKAAENQPAANPKPKDV